MPKTTDADTPEIAEVPAGTPAVGSTLFHFPTVGEGVSIRATTLQEAQEIAGKANKLQ